MQLRGVGLHAGLQDIDLTHLPSLVEPFRGVDRRLSNCEQFLSHLHRALRGQYFIGLNSDRVRDAPLLDLEFPPCLEYLLRRDGAVPPQLIGSDKFLSHIESVLARLAFLAHFLRYIPRDRIGVQSHLYLLTLQRLDPSCGLGQRRVVRGGELFEVLKREHLGSGRFFGYRGWSCERQCGHSGRRIGKHVRGDR